MTDIVRTSDRVDVVRCKDCKHSDTFYTTTKDTMPLKCIGIRYGGVQPDWYCEHGEKRDCPPDFCEIGGE